MNIWPARNNFVRAEALLLSSVSNHFISAQTAGPVNGQVQDGVVGLFELTRHDAVFDRARAMRLVAGVGGEPPHFPAGVRTFTGRDVFSRVLARSSPINYRRPPSSYNDNYAAFLEYEPSEKLTTIRAGRLEGVLDKRAIGAKQSGGVYHLIARESGNAAALEAIYDHQQLAAQALLQRGFTVGFFDLVVTPANAKAIREAVSEVLEESRLDSEKLIRGEIVPPIAKTTREFYEERQKNILRPNDKQLLRAILGSIRPRWNGMFKMIASGAKGGNANLIALCACPGQVLINTERIRENFSFRRTLATFPRFATDPFAYGFIANSYVAGATSTEFTLNMMNGRFDLISKALSTSSTGYFFRKAVMSLQSVVVDNFRRCVKDTRVVQLLYGEDGLDARSLEKVELKTVFEDDAKVAERCGAAGDLPPADAEANGAALAEVRADRDRYRAVFARIERANFRRPMAADLLLPVNVARVVTDVIAARGETKTATENKATVPPESLAAKIATVRDLCEKLPYLLMNGIREKRRAIIPEHFRAAVALLCASIRVELSPKVLQTLAASELRFVAERIRATYARGLIPYGLVVGVLACQSVSEPLTQYMLDSHHRSVGSGTNKAGLVRVGEIYGAKPVEQEQSAAMLVTVRREFEKDQARVQEIANEIEHNTVRHFVARCDTLFEAAGEPRYPPYVGDRAWIAEFTLSHPLIAAPPPDLTRWCFRLALNKSALVLKAMSLERIVERIRAQNPGFYVVHTPESVPAIVLRVYARATLFKRGSDAKKAAEVLEALLDTAVRGISGITSVAVEKITRTRFDQPKNAPASDEKSAPGAITAEGKITPGAITAEGKITPGAITRDPDVWAITTVGTNLYGVLLNRFVDPTGVISTSVGDTLRVFGIEAARAKIISETRAFMEENTPNLRHPMLYADEMTRRGRVDSLERGGLAVREPSNVLLRTAASAPIQVVTAAALNCTKNRVYGLAGPQMLGGTPAVGTTFSTYSVDEEFVRANTKSLDSVLDAL